MNIRERILDMTTRQQAKAWCELNCWQWPDVFQDIKPDGFDELPDYEYPKHEKGIPCKHKNTVFRSLIDSLAEICPRKEQSRYWNTVMHTGEMGMTEEYFEAWWNNGQRDPNEPKEQQ